MQNVPYINFTSVENKINLPAETVVVFLQGGWKYVEKANYALLSKLY